MSLSFLTPVPGRIQSFFNIIADSFETFEMGLTQSPSTSTVQTQTFSGSNLLDWSFVAKMSRHFKESSLFFWPYHFFKNQNFSQALSPSNHFLLRASLESSPGRHGFNESLRAAGGMLGRRTSRAWNLAMNQTKLGEDTWNISFFACDENDKTWGEGILKQSLRKSDMACSSRTTSLHWNSFYWKYVLFFLIRFALASQGFALLAWAFSQQELMADPHFAAHDMPRFSVWENCTEISSKAAFRKSSCQGCGSRSPMRFLCLSTGRRPACNMFSQSS